MTRKKSPQEIEINRLFGQNLKQARNQLKINQTVQPAELALNLSPTSHTNRAEGSRQTRP